MGLTREARAAGSRAKQRLCRNERGFASSIEQRGRDDFDFLESCRAKTGCDPVGGAFNVGFMLAFGADAGNAEEIQEFGKVLVAAIFYKSARFMRDLGDLSPFLKRFRLPM
jgi:hypothetical protein